VADGTSTTIATVNITDNSVPPVGVAGETVVLSSSDSGERIGTVTDAGNGSYTATITSSTAVGTATITATDGGISGQATLTQTAGPPASVTVALSPASIVANGASTSAAAATVTDARGHPLPGQSVKFSSSEPGERIGNVTDAGNGSYTAKITSSTNVGAPTITATDGTVSGQATLTQTVGSAASVVSDAETGLDHRRRHLHNHGHSDCHRCLTTSPGKTPRPRGGSVRHGRQSQYRRSYR
jgi:Invasin, domain 3